MSRRAREHRCANRIQEELIGAPESLLLAPLMHLELSERVYHRLRQIGVKSINDLAEYSDRALLKIQGFGEGALRELHVALELAIRKSNDAAVELETPPATTTNPNTLLGPISNYGVASPAESGDEVEPSLKLGIENPDDLSATWRAFLDLLSERSRAVLAARIGHEGKPKTLEELGRQFGLTRERIRQIQRNAMIRFGRETNTASRLEVSLNNILAERTSPLYLAGLPAEDLWFQHVKPPEAIFGFLIDHLLKGRFATFPVHGRLIASRISLLQWENKQASARSFVEANAQNRLLESTVRLAIDAIAGAEATDLSEELWFHAVKYAHFANVGIDGDRLLVAYGRGVEQMVTVVLEGSSEPLHYKEISVRVEAEYGAQDVRRIHNAADAVSHLLGRGIFGLRRHIPVSASEAKYLVSLCEALVRDGPKGRQWHSTELLFDLQEQEPLARVLNHYELGALLKLYSSLLYAGRHVWTNQSHGRGGIHTRIDIRNAIEAALEEEGQPLTALQIHTRISTIRGLGNTFQVHPRGRLIRVGPSMWGLLDRDVSIPASELSSSLDRVELKLAERQRAIHVSELLAELGRPDQDMDLAWQILGAAQVDSRFRAFASDYLGLAGWAETRRVAVHEAIAAAFPILRVGATLDQVHQIVEKGLERSTSLDVVRAALRDVGAIYDRLSGLWVLPESKDLDDEDDDTGLAGSTL